METIDTARTDVAEIEVLLVSGRDSAFYGEGIAVDDIAHEASHRAYRQAVEQAIREEYPGVGLRVSMCPFGDFALVYLHDPSRGPEAMRPDTSRVEAPRVEGIASGVRAGRAWIVERDHEAFQGATGEPWVDLYEDNEGVLYVHRKGAPDAYRVPNADDEAGFPVLAAAMLAGEGRGWDVPRIPGAWLETDGPPHGKRFRTIATYGDGEVVHFDEVIFSSFWKPYAPDTIVPHGAGSERARRFVGPHTATDTDDEEGEEDGIDV